MWEGLQWEGGHTGPGGKLVEEPLHHCDQQGVQHRNTELRLLFTRGSISSSFMTDTISLM